MNFIKAVIIFSILLIVMLFASCSNDGIGGDEDTASLTEIEKSIVGGWAELGDDGITFLQNGILLYDGKIGHWLYDGTTKILTTDISNKKNQVLMWQINMLQLGSMAGIQIWDGKTFTARRNVKQTLEDILECRSWTRDKNSRFLVINFRVSDNAMEYFYSGGDDFWIYYDYASISEQEFSSITIKSEYGEHIIHNPYHYDKVWFEFPGECKYYPVIDGMSNLEEVNMSKKESMLVGKWICKEQIWDNKIPGHLYFEDEYGMEFSEDRWGNMWSGGDQLMETMGGESFTWWIKDDILYRDNDSHYILQLTDKEMILEWRDGGNIITCKFYKYDENEGLLMDQLEYVDLGLSVKWATRNLGAENLTDSKLGGRYAWGETSEKDEYTFDNYKYCKKHDYLEYFWRLTKYCSDPHFGYNEFVDNKTILDAEDDAATVIRGKEWRMPTIAEFEELVEKCKWEWTSNTGGYSGYKVTGETGYYIFLPYDTSYSYKNNGYYLTKETGDIEVGWDFPPITSFTFGYNSNPKTSKDYFEQVARCSGCYIRPVRE